MIRFKNSYKNRRPEESIFTSAQFQNAAAVLYANVRFSEVEKPIRSIMITSSAPNEGKTSIAISLAIAMGLAGKKVVLVECDMRRRSMRTALKARPKHGIHAFLTNEVSMSEAITTTRFENVFLLDAEAGIPNPDAILSSPVFDDKLRLLSDEFDFAILDTPPSTEFADAAVVGAKADATILVVREGLAKRAEVAKMKELLDAGGANIIGVALNCRDIPGGNYSYSHYYEETEHQA